MNKYRENIKRIFNRRQWDGKPFTSEPISDFRTNYRLRNEPGKNEFDSGENVSPPVRRKTDNKLESKKILRKNLNCSSLYMGSGYQRTCMKIRKEDMPVANFQRGKFSTLIK
ncbi:hypothetical protein GWI33_010643 [Rhynchophorus ferrugineus]|uniref:Uncharacterized protein n=1 Tax=Rhynchophorus ferrugineus TaxID=354439 RepID=A0A834MNA8_RHYFE|nr:hypothetical protein GWI33_010643 [Rhynchophorus ferrugineus]